MRPSPRADTIVAVASGWAPAPRALIRISGPHAHRLLGPPGPVLDTAVPARGCGPARLALAPGLELPLLLIRAEAPRTATGEDTLDLLVPGNPALLRRILQRLTAGHALRPAEPGEFTARAVRNGRLDLERAEGLAALIAAETEADLAAARDAAAGRAGARAAAWAQRCAELLALVEAGIDFTDQEDVRAVEPAAAAGRALELAGELDAELAATPPARPRDELPRVVLAGAPSAGKSTLFNALLGRRRAVTAPEPGTTRDVLEEELDLDPDRPAGLRARVALLDAAGLHADPVHASTLPAARAHAEREIARADVVLWCDPDARFENPLPPPAPGHEHRAVLRVRTMADRPATSPPQPDTLAVCALDRGGLRELRNAIADAARCGGHASPAGAYFARRRHALTLAAEALRAAAGTAEQVHPELMAEQLRHALDALAGVSGRLAPDDVLARIFASFCIGK